MIFILLFSCLYERSLLILSSLLPSSTKITSYSLKSDSSTGIVLVISSSRSFSSLNTGITNEKFILGSVSIFHKNGQLILSNNVLIIRTLIYAGLLSLIISLRIAILQWQIQLHPSVQLLRSASLSKEQSNCYPSSSVRGAGAFLLQASILYYQEY